MAAILAGRFVARPAVLPLARRWGLKPLLILGTVGMAVQYPLLAEVRQSVMAADVLLGNDPECGRWIRTYRVAPAEGEQGRRPNRRRDALSAPAAG